MRPRHGNQSRKKRSGLLRRLVKIVLVVLALPFVLVLVYRIVPPPASTLMVLQMINGQKMDYRWRPAGKISRHLFKAAAVAEDGRICQHNGVDWQVLQGLAIEALDDDGKPVRGGSTIAMQTAKNLFLWPQRSYVRKFLEIPISLWIDYTWPKRRIVEVYLNIAEWGPGIYGAEAASRYHFGISAARLSPRQAALLAAALPNPSIFKAGKPGPKLRSKAQRVEARMRSANGHFECLK
ncbi:MAG: monofunctional biosynthetic peptidoglycan transglycosylase [Aestuariivirgaceae bacterium]